MKWCSAIDFVFMHHITETLGLQKVSKNQRAYCSKYDSGIDFLRKGLNYVFHRIKLWSSAHPVENNATEKLSSFKHSGENIFAKQVPRFSTYIFIADRQYWSQMLEVQCMIH
jgi:hypothetical protein